MNPLSARAAARAGRSEMLCTVLSLQVHEGLHSAMIKSARFRVSVCCCSRVFMDACKEMSHQYIRAAKTARAVRTKGVRTSISRTVSAFAIKENRSCRSFKNQNGILSCHPLASDAFLAIAVPERAICEICDARP